MGGISGSVLEVGGPDPDFLRFARVSGHEVDDLLDGVAAD